MGEAHDIQKMNIFRKADIQYLKKLVHAVIYTKSLALKNNFLDSIMLGTIFGPCG